jgi:rod shape-determining protein MreC
LAKRPESIQRVAAPLRALAQRFAFLFLLLAAGTVLMVGKADPQIFDRARIWVTDAFAPLLDAASKPVATGAAIVDEARHLMHLREENAALRLENSRLLQWQAAARELAAENARLHSLLNYVPAPEATFISARIIAETGGSFVRTMLVNAGRRDGVRKGLPVVIGEGLIGRIVETGERVSRILLINDLNSRIPVAVGDDRERAVLAGDNTSQPKIAYLVANANVPVGARVVTSGQGGVFPPGLPVGIVASAAPNDIRVETFVSSNRLEYVRIMDFGLVGALDDAPRRTGAPAETD